MLILPNLTIDALAVRILKTWQVLLKEAYDEQMLHRRRLRLEELHGHVSDELLCRVAAAVNLLPSSP